LVRRKARTTVGCQKASLAGDDGVDGGFFHLGDDSGFRATPFGDEG